MENNFIGNFNTEVALKFWHFQYVRLFEKYEAAMLKLRNFYETAEYEKKEIKKKYLNEISSLKICFEKELRDIYTEKITAQESLELFLKNNQFCSTIYDDVIEEENSKDIPKEVSCELNVPDKQILDDLFNQYSGIYKRCEENSNLLKEKNIDGHTYEITKKSPEENPILKIDHQAETDCQVEIKDPAINDLEIAERAFKSQIESLLDEIKHSSIKLQQITDDVDSYKTEIADLREEKKDLEELSKSHLAQIFNLNETISSLTHNLKMAELSIESLNNHSKDIEISRLEADFKEMEENFCSAKESCKELNFEINEQKILTQQKEIELVFLKKKLIELEQTNETIALQLKHSEEECDILQNTLNDKENTLLECNAMHMHCDENLELLKKENTILEVRLQEKLGLLSSKALEIELIQTELLAAKYLLSEEEKKTEELDKTLKNISKNMEEKKTEELDKTLKNISKNMEEKKTEELDKTLKTISENMEEKLEKTEELDKTLKNISKNNEEKKTEELDKTLKNILKNMEEKKIEELDKTLKKISENMEEKLEKTEERDKTLKNILKNMEGKKTEELDKTLKTISENMEEKLEKTEELDKTLKNISKNNEEKKTEELDKTLKNISKNMEEKKTEELDKTLKKILENMEEKLEKTEERDKTLKNISKNMEEKKTEELDKTLKKISENMEEKLEKTEERDKTLKNILKNMEEKKIEELDETLKKISESMEEKLKKTEELDKTLKIILKNMENKKTEELDKTLKKISENMEEKLEKTEELDKTIKKILKNMEEKKTEELDKTLKKISENMEEKIEKTEELDKTLKNISKNVEEQSKINLDKNYKNEIESFEVENNMKIKNCSNKLQINDLNNSVDGLKNTTDRFCNISNESQSNADGLVCLNNLIVDNEILSKYLEEQSYLLNDTKLENQNLKKQLEELYATIMVYDNSLEEKKKLYEEMHVRWKTESKIKKEFEQEILLLKEHVKLLNNEIKQYEVKLKTKDKEMEKLNEEFQRTQHCQQSNMVSEKKAIESLEDQIKKNNEDYSIALHELSTTQLLNQMLQARVKELQKWHNNIEVDFFKYKDNLSPHQLIEENLKSRDKFFSDCLVQVKEKISKFNTNSNNNAEE
ncbi:probable DNA double-strand break repair Rad50 ATPase isoform X5 [Hydra vulgaris]|uniref:Probable DNA double-strand break repair Rad50 ATPase isoform X5 n=1 Tax=Hydra vulgaris TaxID=6087 RepID=A0ABM4CE10_HYDVU